MIFEITELKDANFQVPQLELLPREGLVYVIMLNVISFLSISIYYKHLKLKSSSSIFRKKHFEQIGVVKI